MFNRIDANKSTKGASKLRRDLINAEIANLRDLLPLPPSTRQRLSQLQLMALVCVFLRKANYFQQALKPAPVDPSNIPMPNIGFSKAMSGFIMMMTQQGKLLYISENATEYLGHSMEDLLIHGDSVYDVIDKQDHIIVQNQLSLNGPTPNERRLFLCRINVSRNSRRQLRFGDQKVVLLEGHYLPFVPLCNRNECVFLASCTPVVLPETRESVVQGATHIFTTIHSMDMKYLHIDKTAESHMEYNRSELVGVSWYNLLHWDSIRTAYCKHQIIIQSDSERSSTALLRLQSRPGRWFWVHCVLQVRDTSEECQHPVIVCTNQVLSDKEAEVMKASTWLYQFSSQANKFTYGVNPEYQPRQIPSYNHHEYIRRNLVTYDACDSIGIEETHCIEKSEIEYTLMKSHQLSDETEPVDMSINSTDIEQRSLHILSHALTFNLRNKVKNSNHANGDLPKYVNITDLDKGYSEGVTAIVASSTCTTATSIDSNYSSQQKRLIIKTATILDPAEAEDTSWCAGPPIWSDSLQKVPDVVHQDLTPYITSPTTSADTPNSDLYSGTPIFNFDWSTEQNVPNFKTNFRSENKRTQHAVDVHPITLQLPRRKNNTSAANLKNSRR